MTTSSGRSLVGEIVFDTNKREFLVYRQGVQVYRLNFPPDMNATRGKNVAFHLVDVVTNRPVGRIERQLDKNV